MYKIVQKSNNTMQKRQVAINISGNVAEDNK